MYENMEIVIRKIAKTYQLTKSEEKILGFVANGFTSGEIADQLAISVKTVETHRTNCIKKMKLDRKKNALIRFFILNKYQG
jgi:DNA-binding CsgD family transcriptional regulator